MVDVIYWKHCHEKAQNNCNELEKRVKTTKFEVVSKIIKKRFEKVMNQADQYWELFVKVHSAFHEHKKLQQRMEEKKEGLISKEIMNEQVLHKYNELINQHKKFHAIIKQEIDDFDQPLDIPFPMFFDEHGELKEINHWKDELAQLLPLEIDLINDKEMMLKKTHKQLEKIMYMEYTMKDTISNIDTYVRKE